MWQLLALFSAIFSALAAVTEKKTLVKMDALPFSMVISVLTFIFSIPFLIITDYSQISFIALLVLYLKSILGALAFFLVMNGIKHNELSNSLPLLVFTPAFVAVLAFFLLGEYISLFGFLGMFLLLVGTYILQLNNPGNWLSPFYFVKRNKAQWYIIGAILLFTITSLLDKTLLQNYKLPPSAFLSFQQFFFSINFLVAFLIVDKNKTGLVSSIKTNLWALVLVAALAICYRYSHILAVKTGPVALVLSIKRTSVFFATIIGGSYFREHFVFRRSIAVAIMVAGAIAVILL